MTRVAQIETGENTFTQGVPEREEHKPLALRESHPPIKLDDPIQKTASVRVPVPAPATAGKLGPVEKFLSDLKAGKLKDEEVMILQYAYDTGRAKFGVGWRTSEEVARILGWEEINDVSSILSKNYDSAIKRLDLRKLTTVSETTSYGNPREVELIHDMQTLIFDLPDYFSEKIAEIVKTDKEKKEQAKDDEIPF